jgi:hypothetical protein
MKLKLKLTLVAIAIAQTASLCSIFLAVVGGWEDIGVVGEEETDILRELTYKAGNDNETTKPQEDFNVEGVPNKVVLMVIDALRVDMVTADNFPFIFQKRSGVLKFRVNVDSPTVTLPRVKVRMNAFHKKLFYYLTI